MPLTISDSANQYEDLLTKLKVLYPENWPDVPGDDNALFGEDHVTALAQRFNVDQRQAVRAFRVYKENGGKCIPPDLQPLMLAIETIPVCTADCERGFSQMNLIMMPA